LGQSTFVVHAWLVRLRSMSKHAPMNVVVVTSVELVVVTVTLPIVDDVVVLPETLVVVMVVPVTTVVEVVLGAIGWHLQVPSQVAVAGRPEPSHSSPPAESI